LANDTGIQPGAEILALDGKPIKDAALAVSVLWTRKPVSTSAQRRIEQRHKPIQATNVYRTFFERL
jgi:C-terminal processing protease CtpA/Prc